MDLDLWDCLGRVTHFIAKTHRTDLGICSHSRPGKTLSYSQKNTVVCVFSHLEKRALSVSLKKKKKPAMDLIRILSSSKFWWKTEDHSLKFD